MKRFVIVLGLLAVAAVIALALYIGQRSEHPAANQALSSTASPPAPANTTASAPSAAPVAQASSTPGARPLHGTADRPALITAATVLREGQAEPIAEADNRRILLDPVETVTVRAAISARAGEVRVVAPNGGTFNDRRGPMLKDAAKLDGQLEFAFTAGGTRGRYTVEITSGNDTQTLEFWVGQESPQGQPGPDLVFTGK